MQASTLLFATSRPTNRVFCAILQSLPCSCGLSRPCNCSGLRKTPDLSLAPFTGFRLGGSRAQIRRRAVAPAAARSPTLSYFLDTRGDRPKGGGGGAGETDLNSSSWRSRHFGDERLGRLPLRRVARAGNGLHCAAPQRRRARPNRRRRRTAPRRRAARRAPLLDHAHFIRIWSRRARSGSSKMIAQPRDDVGRAAVGAVPRAPHPGAVVPPDIKFDGRGR